VNSLRTLIVACVWLSAGVLLVFAFQTVAPLALAPIATALSLPRNWTLTSATADTSEFTHTGDDARISVFAQRFPNHNAAVDALGKAAAEAGGKTHIQSLGGWPSMSWTSHAPIPRPGDVAGGGSRSPATLSTTLVAVGPDLLHFSIVISPGAPAMLQTDANTIVSGFIDKTAPIRNRLDPATSRDELKRLRRLLPARLQPLAAMRVAPLSIAPGTAPAPPSQPGRPMFVTEGPGELEVAVSDDGTHIVIASNDELSVSRDSGHNFENVSINGCDHGRCTGDPSIAVAASGRFYYSWMAGEQEVEIARSALDFRSFQKVGVAATCTRDKCLTDQPHIAADRRNSSSSGSDRLYLVWRDFPSRNQSPVSRLTCSADGGANWIPAIQIYDTSGDFPRLAVARDGFVYVVFIAGQAVKLSM